MDLPQDIRLPLERGSAWWYWLAGRPALDLVNTRRERWWRDVETLVVPADLAEWFVAAEILASAPPVTSKLLQDARELREAINGATMAVVAGVAPGGGDLGVIAGWLPEALVPDRLSIVDGWPRLTAGEPANPARYALGALARDAAEMLGTEQRGRVRICAAETCSARFYDRSPAGRRRWCSMRECGNVAKARRHRARRAA